MISTALSQDLAARGSRAAQLVAERYSIGATWQRYEFLFGQLLDSKKLNRTNEGFTRK
jgi:hypothetical protein